MFNLFTWCKHSVFLLLILLTLASCATPPQHPPIQELLAFPVKAGDQLSKNAPVFIVENPEIPHNRLASPMAYRDENGKARIAMSTDKPEIFSEVRHWSSSKENYTNLIYRIHFKEIPFSFFPFYLGAGQNIGLLFIVTLDSQNHPLLYTTVHTCGCYLSFTATSYLPKEKYPTAWSKGRHHVYSEYLPGYLDFTNTPLHLTRVNLLLRKATHRVKDMWLAPYTQSFHYPHLEAVIRPLEDLEHLPLNNGAPLSFYESKGPRKDYVRNSQKIWERVFISWWALDWRVGEDKKYGRDKNDGTTFYTSLKPWAREQSDMRDFASFLSYWGWKF